MPDKSDSKWHTHADGTAHSHEPEPLYQGYPARNLNTSRVFDSLGVDIPERSRPMTERLRAAFEKPFFGITTNGQVQSELFTLRKTGISTAAIVSAARSFLAGLRRVDFRRFAIQPLDSSDRRRWINAFPDWMPTGVLLADLEPAERERALKIVEATLSPRGFDEIRKAMKVNQLLGEFVNHCCDTISELAYFFTVFGEPSETSPWGWRLMGYHLTLYCTIIGDQIVLTPAFVVAEMSTIEEGPYACLSCFKKNSARDSNLPVRSAPCKDSVQSCIRPCSPKIYRPP